MGNGEEEVHAIAPLETAGPGEITFLSNPKYKHWLHDSKASAVLVSLDVEPCQVNLIRVSDPYLALAKVIPFFQVPNQRKKVRSPQAHVDSDAEVELDVEIYAGAHVSRGAKIGRGTILYPGVFVGEDARIGEDCILYPNVTVREKCRMGDRVIIHAGAVIGSDGFGFAVEGGRRVKIPQVGIVEIGDNVEIGANTTIDRATLGATRIASGVKIDNLVQIGHNVEIEEDAVIVAQTGIAGSSKIGRGVILAAQVGVADHVVIGDGVVAAARSGVTKFVPGGTRIAGFPAVPHDVWLRTQACLARLHQLFRRVTFLEKEPKTRKRREGRSLPHDKR